MYIPFTLLALNCQLLLSGLQRRTGHTKAVFELKETRVTLPITKLHTLKFE